MKNNIFKYKNKIYQKISTNLDSDLKCEFCVLNFKGKIEGITCLAYEHNMVSNNNNIKCTSDDQEFIFKFSLSEILEKLWLL